MNKNNESYKLNSVFEKFKDYTGYKDNYSASGFARKVQIAFNKYNLSDYILIIKQKDPGRPSHHKQTYFFTEEEKNIVSLFMCSSAPKYGKSKKDFSEEKLNPFSWKANGCNSKLSELQNYIEHLLQYINDNREELHLNKMSPISLDSDPCHINYAELDNINYKIQLSVRLKEILERILTVLYFQENFNSVIFEYMLTRLEGFGDELDIIRGIDEENYPHQKPEYNSADVSLAASLGDALAYSNYLKQNKSEGDKKFLNHYYRTIFTSKNESKKISEPKHSSLSNIGVSRHIPQLSYNYMNYVDKTIEDMVRDFIEIDSRTNTLSRINDAYLKKYGISLDATNPMHYRLESKLFINYVFPEFEKIPITENPDSEKIATEIKEKIHKILNDAKMNTKKLTYKDQYEISSVIDTLLFKPFIHFHKMDIEELKRRTHDNPIY